MRAAVATLALGFVLAVIGCGKARGNGGICTYSLENDVKALATTSQNYATRIASGRTALAESRSIAKSLSSKCWSIVNTHGSGMTCSAANTGKTFHMSEVETQCRNMDKSVRLLE
jgi:hypothetical protein